MPSNVPRTRRRPLDPSEEEIVRQSIRSETARELEGRDEEAELVQRPSVYLADISDEDEDEPPSQPPSEDEDEGASAYPVPQPALLVQAPAPPPPPQVPPQTGPVQIFQELYEALLRSGVFQLDPSTNEYVLNVDRYIPVELGAVNRQGPLGDVRRLYVRYCNQDTAGLASIVNGEGGAYLRIPFDKVYNMKVTLFFYILSVLTASYRTGVKTVSFFFRRGALLHKVAAGNSLTYVVPNFQVNTDRITLNDVLTIYSDIVGRFWSDENPNRDESSKGWSWNESIDSGDCIVFNDFRSLPPRERRAIMQGHGSYLFMKIRLIPSPTGMVATSFNDSIRRIVENVFKSKGLKVVTNDDNLCFLYTFLLGLFKMFYPRCLTGSTPYESSTHVITAALTQCNAWIKEFAERVMRKEVVCDKIETNVDKRFALREFAEVMKQIEDECLRDSKNGYPAPDVAVDVYVMDSEHRVYPAYVSARQSDNRIKMLAISRNQGSHFCLISGERDVWKYLGGKPFKTCAKCKKAFFTNGMLFNHPCDEQDDPSGFHWNTKHACDQADTVHGVCWKCRLKFDCDTACEFHKENCFMKGKNGFRLVKLPEKDYLCGVEETRVDLPKARLYFADFECSIDEEGQHNFMSAGIFSEEKEELTLLDSMDDFMDYVIREASATKEIQVYFHNAMNYDANFILKWVLNNSKSEGQKCWGWSIRVIMKSANRLQKLSFLFQTDKTKHFIEIGDTFHFLTLSLDRIVSSLTKPNVNANAAVFPRFFRVMGEKYGVSDEMLNNVLKKNLFPYTFFDSSSKLDVSMEDFSKVFRPEETNLQFFSDGVSIEDLQANLPLFQWCVSAFKMKTARDYHDLYLACDVLQIADVFMAARSSLWDTHHIDITEYMGMPSASWAAFLRFTPELRIPLYQTTLFAEFFARMTRGGVTSAPLRFARSDESHTIMYLDVNGLYPFVMKKYAYPTGVFSWYVPNEQEASDPTDYLLNKFVEMKVTNRGFCACVDLHYTDEVKEKTDQFPFAPDHMLINDQYFDEDGNLYPFLQRWSDENDGAIVKPFKGLVATLYDKQRYCVHWKLLKWYMKHGLQVTKIHNMVFFNEEKYLAPYVSHNISLRNERTDELGKMVYKLMGNSIYGKTFENPFNHYKYVIVRNRTELDGLIQTANVDCIAPIDEENSVVKLTGDEVELDKPTYIGACVTEYAKLHMYKLFYDKIGGMFPKVELIYTDTDSFIVRVEHNKNMHGQALIDYMNSSGPLIGKEGGLIKSETGTDFIREVIALRSKVYAYVTEGGHIGKRAKGTTGAAQRIQLSWESYKQVLLSLRAVPTTNMQFSRSAFQIASGHITKISLDAADGKRKIEEDGIHTHAFGYHEI